MAETPAPAKRQMAFWLELAGLLIVLIALLVRLVAADDDDLPDREHFFHGAALLMTLIGLAIMLAGVSWRWWRRQRRLAERQRQAMVWQIPDPAEPPEQAALEDEPQPWPRKLRRAIIWQVVAYVLGFVLAAIAFEKYMETNPLPDWLTQEAFEREYAPQIAALKACDRFPGETRWHWDPPQGIPRADVRPA